MRKTVIEWSWEEWKGVISGREVSSSLVLWWSPLLHPPISGSLPSLSSSINPVISTHSTLHHQSHYSYPIPPPNSPFQRRKTFTVAASVKTGLGFSEFLETLESALSLLLKPISVFVPVRSCDVILWRHLFFFFFLNFCQSHTRQLICKRSIAHIVLSSWRFPSSLLFIFIVWQGWRFNRNDPQPRIGRLSRI